MIGKTISHYKILEKLGEGGMGIVYKAHDTKLDRDVALKLLPHYLTSDPIEKDRFYHEAKAASSLNHPNVITIYEINEFENPATAGKQLYIAMEYVEGKTLKQIIEHETLTLDKIIDIAIQVCDGLAAAHEKGIVHRDIKSANIMVTPKGQVQIMDFGLAKVQGATKLTKTGSTLGTAAYMSPEQARGEEVDCRSDIFSFGVVLYEIITNKLPFRGEHQAALAYSIVNEEPPPLAPYNKRVTDELQRIVSKALEKDKEDRYQHIDDMLADLRHERKKLEYAKSGILTTKGSAVAAHRPKRFPAKIVVGIAVIVVLIALVIILNPFSRKISLENVGASVKESIAVMYFENRSGEKDLDKQLVELLNTNLGRNRKISVVSGQRLYDILKNLGKQDISVIDQSTATSVAKQAGVRTMLLGAIWRVGEKFTVTSQLLDVESGAVLNSDRIEAIAKPEEMLHIADSLTEEVYAWLNVSQAEPVHIADALTSSYDAYKYYERGLRYTYRFQVDSAVISFQEATRIDPTFGMAYLWLSFTQGQFDVMRMIPGRGLGYSRETVSKAERFSKGFSDKDKRSLEAWGAYIYRDFTRSDSIYRILVNEYPQENVLWTRLSEIDMCIGRYHESIREWERVIELDRSDPAPYNNLSFAYRMTHEYEKAISSLKTYMALLPDAWNSYDSGCDLYEMAGKPDEAMKILEEGHRRVPSENHYYFRKFQVYLLMGYYEKAREEIRKYSSFVTLSQHSYTLDFSDAMADPEIHTSFLYLLEGRLNVAVDLLTRDIEGIRSRDNKAAEIIHRFWLGRILMEGTRLNSALDEFRVIGKLSEEVNRGTFNPWPFVVEYYSGLCNLRKGEIAQAELNASNLQSLIQQREESFYSFLFDGLRADIELAQGKPQEALASTSKLLPWAQEIFPRNRILRARIYTQAGDIANALSIYDETYNHTISRESYMGGDFLDFYLERSKLDYYKAKMYQKFNDRANAIKFYEKAIKNWGNADKDYPALTEARVQLVKMNEAGKK